MEPFYPKLKTEVKTDNRERAATALTAGSSAQRVGNDSNHD
jgi:hypothetical protein